MPKAFLKIMLLVSGAFAALLPACVQKNKIDTRTLIIGIESEVKNLDVRNTNDANAFHVISLFSQSLVKVSPKLLAEGDLAQSIEIKNAQTYTFHLPHDATFHNGRPLTSADVEACFRQAAGPTSRRAKLLEQVEHFSSPDAYTFVIQLKKPNASFLLNTVADIRIQPKDSIDDPNFGEHPIGSGPFKFVRRRDRDLIFTRFDQVKRFSDGQLQPLSSFEKVIVRSVQDPTTRFLSLMGGDIDLLINALSPQKIQEAAQNRFLQVLHSPGTTYQYIGFNLRLPKFQDVRVRRALAMAIDRDEIIRHKFYGLARPAASVLSSISFYGHPQLPPQTYNPDLAKKLLKEAGQTNLSFELKMSTDRDTGSMLLVLKEYWERIGVHVTLRPFEFATFFADIQKGNFEAYCLRWTGVVDPDLLNNVFHSQEVPPGKNRVYYKNLELDKLLDQARSEMNLSKRQALYFKVQEIIAADTPYISLWYLDNMAVASANLKNFILHPTGSWQSFLSARKESP